MKTKILFSCILIVLALGLFFAIKTMRQAEYVSHVPAEGDSAAYVPSPAASAPAAPFEWTEEERKNVSEAQPALVAGVKKQNGGWEFSLDYLSTNPKFVPGITGPYWLNESTKLRTAFLAEDSAAAKNGILICNDAQYPKYKKVDDWTVAFDSSMPYGFTIKDGSIVQIHLICVP